MTDQGSDRKPGIDDHLEKFAHLDSMEGLSGADQLGKSPPFHTGKQIRRLLPGFLIAAVVALAASFLSSHYGGPVMFFALLIGLAFDFLSEEEKTAPGIEFSSKTVLRLGVALLGARITLEQVASLGLTNVVVVASAVIVTIFSGILFARLLGVSRDQGLLSGGAVAICGASAALAISSVMPKSEHLERNTIFTVVSVTTLSTIAMIAYPILAGTMGLSDQESGVFLGGTIHDVAQVVGAGYTISEPAGDMSTIVKLLRVSMLLPVVLLFSLVFRSRREEQESGKRPPLVPLFLVGFATLVLINSTGFVPQEIMTGLGTVSRWCLIIAISALGMKTSFKVLALIGWRPVALVVAETLTMALFVLAYIIFA